MASIKKISDLTEISSANNNDFLIINQDGNTRKIAVKNLNINSGIISVNGSSKFIDVEEYGAVGDGVTDDTAAFQRALDSGLNITATRGKSYLIRKSLSIKTNGQIIDLDNATILLNHATDYTSGGDLEALFMVCNDNFTALSLEEIHLSQGYLNITNASSNLVVGDFLRILGHQGSYVHNGNELKEVLQIMVQVIAIDGTKVLVDYSTPVGGFNFDTTSPSSLFSSISCAKVTKVIKNVQIRNMFIRDITEYSTSDSKALSGITGKFVSRMIVENVAFENMLLNGLTFNFGHNCMCNNISGRLARRSTGGKGYLVRLMACNKIQASNLYGYQVRHVFDITGGAYYEIRNAYGYNTQAGAFSLHGNCEHDIYLYNLDGVDNKNDSQILGFGSGAVSGTGFPNAVDNVNIYSSNVKIYTEGYSMFGRVIFNDSHVKMYVTLPRVIFNNCYLSARLPLYPRNSKRNRNIKLYQIFNNCDINVSDANTGFDYVQATNCRITALNVGCTNALISNSVIKSLTVNSTNITANTSSNKNIIQGNLFI